MLKVAYELYNSYSDYKSKWSWPRKLWSCNAHTVIRHRLDPSLANTLQHRFASGHNNILSEIKWSVFHCDFSPGFKDVLEHGIQRGWYDVNDTLENWVISYPHSGILRFSCCCSLLFHWIAIWWLQAKFDNHVKFKNTTAPHVIKNKILSHGIPALIRSLPSHFNAVDFKVALPWSLSYLSLMLLSC